MVSVALGQVQDGCCVILRPFPQEAGTHCPPTIVSVALGQVQLGCCAMLRPLEHVALVIVRVAGHVPEPVGVSTVPTKSVVSSVTMGTGPPFAETYLRSRFCPVERTVAAM